MLYSMSENEEFSPRKRSLSQKLSKRYSKLVDKFGSKLAAVIVVLPVFVVLAVPGIAINLVPGEHDGCLVTGKDRGGQKSHMRVYTENCGTFSVQDNLLLLRFDSADVYGAIEPGQTYNLKTAGLRVPLFSWFPNVLEATPAP